MSDSFSREEMIGRLKEVQFFKMFADNDEIMGKIASMCTTRSFASGKHIIRESEFGDDLFILVNGEIEILKSTLQKEEYTVATLNADMKGIYVGEMALIDNDTRSASVMAKTRCDCLVISREEFLKFGNENPRIGLMITRVIASQISTRLRKSNADVITLFSALVEENASEA